LPAGADLVVPVEQTDAGTRRVRIDQAPAAGAHIRAAGDDVRAGTVVLPAGTVVGAAQIGAAAALGLPQLPVYRPITVLVLSTGSELVEPGSALGPGQIYESNGSMLAAAVTQSGAAARTAHFVADDVDAFRAALAGAAAGVDLIVTSGGVSAGAYEVVKDALTGQGIEFAKVAMQPGMPQGAGRYRGVPMVTLPGNPVSSYVSFEVFLRPAIRAAMGHPDITRPTVTAPLSAPLDSPAGKRQVRRGHLDAVDGTVAAWGGPGSHLLAWLAGADCMLVIGEDVTHLDVGDEVEVWLLG
jgi:molybdopterin molybdotransferase